jgi:hypothetical protein
MARLAMSDERSATGDWSVTRTGTVDSASMSIASMSTYRPDVQA